MEFSLAGGAGGPFETRDDVAAYLRAVSEAGFSRVSLGRDQIAAVEDGATSPTAQSLRTVARLVEEAGLRCSDVLSLLVRRDDAGTVADARQLAAVAEALGADFVLTLLYTRVSEESIDRLGRCAEIVRAGGARLALEFAPGGAIDSIGGALPVVEQVGADRAAVLIDTWHFFRGPSEWADLQRIPLERIALVQFDDALPAVSDDIMVETMDRRTWPGEGTFDLARFTSTLTQRGWDGLVSVEVLSSEHRLLDVSTFARRAFETTRPFWPGVAVS